MEQEIRKIHLATTDVQVIKIKNLAEVLSVAVQRGILVLYFMYDESIGIEVPIEVTIKGTGNKHHPRDTENRRFMGTHVVCGGDLMWHVWLRDLL